MTDPYANIRRALEMVCDPEADPKRWTRALTELRLACDPDTIRALLAERDQLADALEAAQMGLRYTVRVWVLSDEIKRSNAEIDEVVESIISDAKKEAGRE